MTELRTDARTVGLIAAGGATGTLLRDLLSRAVPVAAATFPTTTLAINVSGAFVLGVLLGALSRYRPADTTWSPLLGVGVLGAFTTFSTFAVETVQLQRAGRALTAVLYVAASVVGGLVAARIGEWFTGAAPASIREDEA